MLKVLLFTIITYFTTTFAEETCVVTDDQGKIWDLSKFSTKDFEIVRSKNDHYAIVYRTCGKTSITDCIGNTCFIAQSTGTTIMTLSHWEASGMTVTAIDNGVKIQYRDVDPFPERSASFSIEFKCGSNYTSTYTADFNDFVFAAYVEDPSFCSDDDDGDDGEDGNLQCQLTRYSPSIVVATMENHSYDDVSQKSIIVSLDAKDFGGFQYQLSSCFLQTNIGGGSFEENVYEISMHKSDHNHNHNYNHNHDHSSQSVVNSNVTFRGTSQFRPNSTLGQFKVYCPLVAPNLQVSNIPMSVSVTIGSKIFTQSSSECQFHPYRGIAKNVEIQSNLSINDNFIVKIMGLYQVVKKNTVLYVGFTPVHYEATAVTLGTISKYYFDDPDRKYGVKCTLDGQEGLVHAYESSHGIDLTISTTLSSYQDYTISCSHMASSITSGNYFIPSIAYVTDSTDAKDRYSMATNIFV